MKAEVIIKNWLMAWLKPEKVESLGITKRPPLTEDNFPMFISQFVDLQGRPEYSDDEVEVLKRVILHPVKFGTGYPINDKETIQPGTIYFIEGGWQQTTSTIGDNIYNGKSATQLAITGLTKGHTQNMAEVSIFQTLVTSLLLAGRQFFIMNFLDSPTVAETPYTADEQLSRQNGIAIRTTTINYESYRSGIVTPR